MHRKAVGVVVRPTGTEKSSTIRKLCNRDPKGILYLEVVEPKDFTTQLASEMGMKVSPSNFLDKLLSYFATTYTLHYSLPSDQEQALNKITKTFKSVGIKFTEEHGKHPTLFIDGVDLLVKTNEDLFIHLLMQVTNEGLVIIVLVSSEGAVVPIIQKFAGVSRCNKMFKVTDTDDVAIDYLMKMGFSSNLSKKLVQYTGGRCNHLANSVYIYDRYTTMNQIDDDRMYNKIIEDLFSLKISNQCKELKLNEPFSTIIVQYLANKRVFPIRPNG